MTLSPSNDASSLGNVLIKLGRLNRDQLWQAIERKSRNEDYLLGALLRDMGLVNDTDIATALSIQAKMRNDQEAHAELDILDEAIEETRAGCHELARLIEEKHSPNVVSMNRRRRT